MKAIVMYKILIPFLLVFFCVPLSLGETGGKKILIRRPAVAGSFYTGNAKKLKSEIDEMLKASPDTPVKGEVLAATAPHAGYVYSGSIAARTFSHIKNIEFDTIVIIGHDTYRDAVAYTCPVDYFETPLGRVKVDTEMIEGLHAYNKGIKDGTGLHIKDHTIEIQLPFLQAMNKNCMIVPLMFGNPTYKNCSILAEAIKKSGEDKKVFILASTDMSHYPDYNTAYKLDNKTLGFIKKADAGAFLQYAAQQQRHPEIPELQTAICASGGVGTAILYSKGMGMNHVEVLKYANSGDVPGGDRKRVVGYSSVLFIRR